MPSVEHKLTCARSFLFVPASRPDRFRRALMSGADAVVLDLEDAVCPDAKADARKAAVDAFEWMKKEAAGVILVRINSPKGDEGKRDLDALVRGVWPDAVILPKCERPDEIQTTLKRFDEELPVMPAIENAAGYAALREIAGTRGVHRLAVGHIDFMADLGMQCSPDQHELNELRFQTVLASRLALLPPPVDGVTVAMDDNRAVRADAERALRYGFGGKLCIHPTQIATVHEAFTPSSDQIAWAERVVEVMELSQGAAVRLDGKLADLPVLYQARKILARRRV